MPSSKNQSETTTGRDQVYHQPIGNTKVQCKRRGISLPTKHPKQSLRTVSPLKVQVQHQPTKDGDGQPLFGGWQSDQDFPQRKHMVFRLARVMQGLLMQPGPKTSPTLICVAAKIEKILYQSALTEEEYLDCSTLRMRLKMVQRSLQLLSVKDGLHLAPQA